MSHLCYVLPVLGGSAASLSAWYSEAVKDWREPKLILIPESCPIDVVEEVEDDQVLLLVLLSCPSVVFSVCMCSALPPTVKPHTATGSVMTDSYICVSTKQE